MPVDRGLTRITVVDRHELFAEALDVALTLAGHRVHRVSAYEQALPTNRLLAVLQRSRPRVVLLDPDLEDSDSTPVIRPLAEAGIDKAAVRRIARALELPCADKPAAPCLASRIPHFQEVSPEKLAQIEAAEKALRQLGFDDSRVRHHGEVARIELASEDLVRAVSIELRERVHAAVRQAGFRFVALDLAGIQSGAFTLPLVGVSHG